MLLWNIGLFAQSKTDTVSVKSTPDTHVLPTPNSSTVGSSEGQPSGNNADTKTDTKKNNDTTGASAIKKVQSKSLTTNTNAIIDSIMLILKAKEDTLNMYREQNSYLLGDSIPKILNAGGPNNHDENLLYAIITLSVITLILFILFLLSKRDAKNQKKSFHNDIKLLNDGIKIERSKNEGLKMQIDSLSSEKKKLGDEFQKFRIDINQNPQRQKSNDVQQTTTPIRSPYISSPPPEPPKSLYADSIFDGKFNRVRDRVDDDTIFELKLSHPNDTSATVVVYEPSYRRVIANPVFLEGCEKHVLGSANTSVDMLRNGIAVKDSEGRWRLTTVPEVQIS